MVQNALTSILMYSRYRSCPLIDAQRYPDCDLSRLVELAAAKTDIPECPDIKYTNRSDSTLLP